MKGRITAGEKIIPKTVITAKTSAKVQNNLLANSQTSSLRFFPHVSGKHGYKGGAHGALAYQTTEKVRDAVGKDKRISDMRGAQE